MNMNAGYIQAQHGAVYSYIDEIPMLSWPYCSPRPDNMGIKNSEHDQEILQSQTADKTVASRGRAKQH